MLETVQEQELMMKICLAEFHLWYHLIPTCDGRFRKQVARAKRENIAQTIGQCIGSMTKEMCDRVSDK